MAFDRLLLTYWNSTVAKAIFYVKMNKHGKSFTFENQIF